MFKNFDKVFKFTFSNQTKTKGYKFGTVAIAVLLILIPIIIGIIASKVMDDKKEGLKICGAEKIYMVNESYPDINYDFLNFVGVEGYTEIIYENAGSIDEALEKIKADGEKQSFVYDISVSKESVDSSIILPEDTLLSEEEVQNFDEFISRAGMVFTTIAMGKSLNDLGMTNMSVDYDVYNVKGYQDDVSLYESDDAETDKNSSEIISVFRIIIVIITVFVIYMVIILYASGVSQNIVMEKTSKLMDTMLISVKPEALIMGKYLGVLAAGMLQLLIWFLSICAGIFAATKILGSVFEGAGDIIKEFLKMISDSGLFKPGAVVISLLVLIAGILFYTSIAALLGSISNTREEVGANQGLFVMLVLISFYFVLFGGAMSGKDVPMWQNLVPFTSAMVLPSGICLGTVPMYIAIIGLLLISVCSVIFIILSGKMYRMMSLYKGNRINIVKAFKMLFSGV